MARAREHGLAGLTVQDQVENGGHRLLDSARHEPVEARHHLSGRGLDEAVGAARVAELAHRRRRAEPLPDDIADHQRDAPVGALEHVVPVAADGRLVTRGQVTRRQLETLDLGQPLRQQAALQGLGDAVLLLVDLEQPPLHRLALVDVDRGAHVADEAPAHVAGHAAVGYPAVVLVAAPQAVLALPGTSLGHGRVP